MFVRVGMLKVWCMQHVWHGRFPFRCVGPNVFPLCLVQIPTAAWARLVSTMPSVLTPSTRLHVSVSRVSPEHSVKPVNLFYNLYKYIISRASRHTIISKIIGVHAGMYPLYYPTLIITVLACIHVIFVSHGIVYSHWHEACLALGLNSSHISNLTLLGVCVFLWTNANYS